MLDPLAGIRPLVRILERKLHAVGADPAAIDKEFREPPVADHDIVGELDLVAECFAARQLGIDKGAIPPVQIGVGEIADIVDDDRVMGPPGEIERHASPPRRPFEFRDLRHGGAVRARRIAGKKPDQPIAGADRIGTDFHLIKSTPNASWGTSMRCPCRS